MRGCVDRLLLFGMDVDVKEAIISYDEMCRTMDRQLLQLVPLNQDNPLVHRLIIFCYIKIFSFHFRYLCVHALEDFATKMMPRIFFQEHRLLLYRFLHYLLF